MAGEPADDAATGTDAAAGAERRTPRRRAWIIGASSTLAVAVVGATVSAVITPERVDALFGLLGIGTTSAAPSPTPTPEYKTVASLDDAITVDVPTDWAVRNGSYDVTEFAGTAVIAGTQVATPVQFGEEGAYIGASAEFATMGDLAAASDDAIEGFLATFVEEPDWALEGCVPDSSAPPTKAGWLVDARAWKDCASVSGSRLWEIGMIPDDRSSFVSIQILLTSEPDEVMDRIVDSLVVIDAKLPASG